MQLELRFEARKPPLDGSALQVGGRRVLLRLVLNRRARRYILRLRPNGEARVTVPRGGSYLEGRRFAERNGAWLERQLIERVKNPVRSAEWKIGDRIFFRGRATLLEAGPCAATLEVVRLGDQDIALRDKKANLREAIEAHLRSLAKRELPARVLELAALHDIPVTRVSVRNQRSRWGSCSRRRTISLNWRLVQAPEEVRDYIVLHELAHLKEMNHSKRFWTEVERLCPGFRPAEAWLKKNGQLLK